MNIILILLIIVTALGLALIISEALMPTSSITDTLSAWFPDGSRSQQLLLVATGVAGTLLLHRYVPKTVEWASGRSNGSQAQARLIDAQ